MKFLLILCVFINFSFAQTHNLRSDSQGTVILGYEPLTTWMPSKFALSYTHIFNKKFSLEFEYAWSSVSADIYVVDFGSVSEKRFSLLTRHYMGNSFHFIYGLFRNDFYARVGGDLLEDLSRQSFDYFRVVGTGITLGIGNRWQSPKGITWGVDWIKMNVPLLDRRVEDDILNYVESESSRKDLKEVIGVVKNVPTFTLLALHLGYTF